MNKINEKLVQMIKEDDDAKTVLIIVACILLALLVITVSWTIGSLTHFLVGMLFFIGLGALAVYAVFYSLAWLSDNGL